MPKFNERLRLLRTSRGLSQSDLAKFLGISKSSVNMYERGEREPGLETLEAIGDFFNVDMDYLLGKSEHRNKNEWLATFEFIQSNSNNYSPHEKEVIKEYRAKPEMQAAVDKLLGIEPDSLDTLKQKPFIAAASGKKYDAESLDIDTMLEIENMGNIK